MEISEEMRQLRYASYVVTRVTSHHRKLLIIILFCKPSYIF